MSHPAWSFDYWLSRLGLNWRSDRLICQRFNYGLYKRVCKAKAAARLRP